MIFKWICFVFYAHSYWTRDGERRILGVKCPGYGKMTGAGNDKGKYMEKRTLTMEELLLALEQTLQGGGSFPLRVTGWSMYPLLRHEKDMVWLQACDPAQCRWGSIVLFRRKNGRLVLHRIRRRLPGGYRMNGDGQNWCEDILQEQVLAQAVRICRGDRGISCQAVGLRLWNMLWFPTRPIRPILFRLGHRIKKCFCR